MDFSLSLIGSFLRIYGYFKIFKKKIFNYLDYCGGAVLEIGGELVVYYNSLDK